MSYPGSQQQFGVTDLQLLQQQLMLARLQELQKQQQPRKLGGGKPPTSLNNLSLFAKHTAGDQIPNLGSGTPFNGSNMFTSSNLNWMHHSVSSSMQEMTQGTTYLHGEGLMTNPALQQPDISLYTPVVTGRGNLGQYSSMQGASHRSVNMLSVKPNENSISQVPEIDNIFFGDKHSVPQGHGHSIDGSFQEVQEKCSAGQASLQLLSNGMSPGKSMQVRNLTLPPENNRITGQVGATRFLREQTKQTNASQATTTLDPLEEKILFDTGDCGWGTSFSKLAAIDTDEYLGAVDRKEYVSAFPSIQSGSWIALMQSAVAEASSSENGIQEESSGLSFQKQPSDLMSNEQEDYKWSDSQLLSSSNNLRAPLISVDSMQPKHPVRWSDCQQLPIGSVPAGHPVNNVACLNDNYSRDLSQGSRTSALLMSSMIRNGYDFIQHSVDSYSYLPTNDDTDQKDDKSMVSDHLPNSNPMAFNSLYKGADENYGSRNHYQEEKSCDSFNSKQSQAHLAQVDHACIHADDSVSSASSQKSQKQALSISSPRAHSHLKTTDAFSMHTMGKRKLSAEAFPKGSPASDISASFYSQNAFEHNKASKTRDHRSKVQIGFSSSQTESEKLDMPYISVSLGAFIPDRFSFQSSAPGGASLFSLGDCQKGQTWWTPSSFGHSFPRLQGASLPQSCSGMSNVLRKTLIETSNLKSERNSLEGLFSGPLHVKNQLDGEHVSEVFETSDSLRRTSPETIQQISFSGSPSSQDAYTLQNVSSCLEHNPPGVSSVTQAAVFQGTYHQDVKPLNVWMDVPRQKDMIDLSSLRPRSSTMGKGSSYEQKGEISESAGLKDCQPEEKYPKISTDDSAFAGSSINQEGYVHSGLVRRSSSGETFRAVPTYIQPQLLPNIDSVKQQVDIADTDLNMVANSLCALSNLNKQWIPDVPGQQPPHETHKLAKDSVGNQLDSCLSGDNVIPAISSGESSSLVYKSSRPPAIQHICSHKVPIFAEGHLNGNSSNTLSDQMRHLYRSSVPTAIKASENMLLNDTISQYTGTDANRNYGILPGLANQMVPVELSQPSSVLSSDAVNLVVSRTKKRKTAMYDYLPWHKEVMKTRQVLPDISIAEQEWAEVSNRLIEKCFDEGERNEEMRPAVRAKRRLILTTKLMQLVFHPPPQTILSVDACIEYEIVAYSITKLALADACCWIPKTRTDCTTTHDIGSMDRNNRKCVYLFDKATELFQRTKELEIHIERLSKVVSVVDVLVDCQELEKFRVINHFAKYHSRVPGSVATESPSSSTCIASVRPLLRRYVSAVPLPPNIPKGVQCLSL